MRPLDFASLDLISLDKGKGRKQKGEGRGSSKTLVTSFFYIFSSISDLNIGGVIPRYSSASSPISSPSKSGVLCIDLKKVDPSKANLRIVDLPRSH